ncbi:MAG: LytTR family DNA-binding domain-containing protein [Oscillospiraceae bacterium]
MSEIVFSDSLKAARHYGEGKYVGGCTGVISMLQVAICDDHIEELSNLSALLDAYRFERRVDLLYTVFQSPLDLISTIEKGTAYDVILLDVVMPGLNGIDAAKDIRSYDKNVKIIFLTTSAEFAVESYAVAAYFYQLKPVWKDSLFTLMDRVSADITRAGGESLVVRCKTGILRILIDQLVCCEVVGKTLLYHLSSGAVLESTGNMKNLEQSLLRYPCFVKPHRSYLVNMDAICDISYQEIKLVNGMKIPIPRGKYGELKEAFLANAFQGRTR